MIEFGKTYRDMVSGFEGICIGMVEWLYGCKQYILSPKAESASKRETSSTFYEKQLEFVDDGISARVEVPEIKLQRFFGKECVDKVTQIKGICIGRYIWLFNCDQYVLEFTTKEDPPQTKVLILDEGRVDVVPNPTREVDPEDVESPRPGGVLMDYPSREYPSVEYPYMDHPSVEHPALEHSGAVTVN